MAEKVKYKPVPIEQVKQGDWVSIRKITRLFSGPKTPVRYYVAKSERGFFHHQILWLLDSTDPAAPVKRFAQDFGRLVLVEVK